MKYVRHVDHNALHAFIRQVFEATGVRPEHAQDGADVLMWASRRGVDTHGVRNLRPLYLRLIDQGLINLDPAFRIEHETPVSARVDGDGGLGLAAACWAMHLALDKARQSGVGMVAMRNSYHFGAAGYYPWLALQRDMIGVGMTGRFSGQGADYGVPPTFGAKAMFSTNPLSIGFPTADEPPYLLDMATSAAPYNRVAMHRDNDLPIPPGWGLDADGQPTVDPAAVRQLIPLGGSRALGGHKGYGLAMMVEVLCGVLSGAWMDGAGEDPEAFEGHHQQGDAHFFAAIRVDFFRPLEDFKRGMDAMIRALHAAPKVPGQKRIYVAGEIEHETEQERLAQGVPLTPTIVADLEELSRRFGVPVP